MGSGECGFTRIACWGDSILTALTKMKQTDHHQHSDGLLQEFYTMTQKHDESTGKYAIRLDMAAGKVWLQSQEALGGTPDEQETISRSFPLKHEP